MNARTFFSDRPIAYHPILAKAFGSVTAALFLSQLAYWADKGASGDGWIWKTEREMEDETGLSRSEQQTARKVLKEAGVLQEDRRGVPARMWYLINWDALEQLLEDPPATSCRKAANQLSNSCNPVVENLQTGRGIPANYSETSPEITPEITPVVAAPAAHCFGNAETNNYDHLAEKALEKATAKPKQATPPEPETEFGAQLKAYETEFFPIGHMSLSEMNTFGELWDELIGAPASISPVKVARTFDKAQRELVGAIKRERKKGRTMRPSANLFKKFVYDIVREDFEWVEVSDDGATDTVSRSEGDSAGNGRIVHGAAREGITPPSERTVGNAAPEQVSRVPRGRFHITGPLSHFAPRAGGAPGNDP